VPVVPDFLANVGTNAWWWWVVFGDVAPTADAAFARQSSTLRRLTEEVAGTAERDHVSLRTAALAIADGNAAALEDRHLGAAQR
jgi:glutamate dehydrogenase (NAD(P)+)